ncbi:MAG: esterase [Saprospiraceae bacterium]|nr:esterase [Saprospiraceae bacterium]
MKKTTPFLFLLWFCLPLAAQTLQTATGTVLRLENFPSKFISSRHVDVWLPDGYSRHKKYAVLYMHDGQMLFDSASTWNKQEWGVDETMGRLLAAGKIRNCIVVGIWNNSQTRHSDYFPQKPFESLPPQLQDSLLNYAKRNQQTALFTTAVNSDNYLRFLVNELKPHIDSHFSTKKDRKDTFIAGSSMGGLISMYAICEYPKVFGGAACLSTHWPGTFATENNPIPDAFFQYLNAHLPNPKTHKFYFDYGTATLDAFYEPFQLKADQVMTGKGYTAKNWITRKFEGEDHSERAWRGRLHVPLEFLLK